MGMGMDMGLGMENRLGRGDGREGGEEGEDGEDREGRRGGADRELINDDSWNNGDTNDGDNNDGRGGDGDDDDGDDDDDDDDDESRHLGSWESGLSRLRWKVGGSKAGRKAGRKAGSKAGSKNSEQYSLQGDKGGKEGGKDGNGGKGVNPLTMTFSGVLEKKGHVRKTWKTRHFILCGDQLAYFAVAATVHGASAGARNTAAKAKGTKAGAGIATRATGAAKGSIKGSIKGSNKAKGSSKATGSSKAKGGDKAKGTFGIEAFTDVPDRGGGSRANRIDIYGALRGSAGGKVR
jgi:hypothetical protein